MSLVSILLPTFNQEKFIRRAVESAQKQNYNNLEIVISDDFSTDGTFSIVQSLAKQDLRIRVNKNPSNIGRLANYHKLIYELAKGDFVINLDGDDELLNSNYISNAMALIKSNPDIKLVFAKQYIRKSEGMLLPMKAKFPMVMDGKEFFLDYPDIPTGIPHLSALFHKEHAISRGVQETDTIASDTESLLRILPGIKVGYIDEYIGAWTEHDYNQSGLLNISKRLSHFLMVISPADYFQKNQLIDSCDLIKWRKRYLQRVLKENLIFINSKGDLNLVRDFLTRARTQFGVQLSAFDLLDLKFLIKFLLQR